LKKKRRISLEITEELASKLPKNLLKIENFFASNHQTLAQKSSNNFLQSPQELSPKMFRTCSRVAKKKRKNMLFLWLKKLALGLDAQTVNHCTVLV